jgi:hypothetical protein
MTRTEAKQALIAALSDDTPYDLAYPSNRQPRDIAIRDALIGFVNSLDTVVAAGLIADLWENLDADERNGDFAALELVSVGDVTQYNVGHTPHVPSVSPFDILDAACAQLRDNRQERGMAA